VVGIPMAQMRQLAPLVQQAGLKISRELGFQIAAAQNDKNSLSKPAASPSATAIPAAASR